MLNFNIMNDSLSVSPKDFVCPFCKQKKHVGDIVGKVQMTSQENTKYRFFFIGLEERFLLIKYNLYCCEKCFRKKKFLDKLLPRLLLFDVVITFVCFACVNSDTIVIVMILCPVLFLLTFPFVYFIKKIIIDDEMSYTQARSYDAIAQ